MKWSAASLRQALCKYFSRRPSPAFARKLYNHILNLISQNSLSLLVLPFHDKCMCIFIKLNMWNTHIFCYYTYAGHILNRHMYINFNFAWHLGNSLPNCFRHRICPNDCSTWLLWQNCSTPPPPLSVLWQHTCNLI